MKRPKALRRHGSAPPNWRWREGRPRWAPSPALRAAGWKGLDLKDQAGKWLGEGASIDRAREIASAVAAWRAGARIEPRFAAIAPPGAIAQPGAHLPPPIERLSIGALADAWLASPEFKGLKPSTARDYGSKLKRLVDVLAGWVELPADRDDPTYLAEVADTRALPIFALEPQELASGIVDPLYTAYWKLHGACGVHMAAGTLAVAGVWLGWSRRRQSRRIHNWAAEVERETPPGRIRVLTWDELAALVRAADAMGWFSIGDSIILGVDLSWSQADRLALTWDRIDKDRAMTGSEGRRKTGRVGGTPFLNVGLARLAQVRQRQAAMAAHPTHVLWCEATGAPWKADHYRHIFAEVRARAVLEQPSLADARDQDLRDTAVTVAYQAQLSDHEIASRTLHSLRRIKDILDKHYGEIGPEIADAGKAKLDEHLRKAGVKL